MMDENRSRPFLLSSPILARTREDFPDPIGHQPLLSYGTQTLHQNVVRSRPKKRAMSAIELKWAETGEWITVKHGIDVGLLFDLGPMWFEGAE